MGRTHAIPLETEGARYGQARLTSSLPLSLFLYAHYDPLFDDPSHAPILPLLLIPFHLYTYIKREYSVFGPSMCTKTTEKVVLEMLFLLYSS